MRFFKLVVVSRASRIRNMCELFCTQLSKTFLLSITLGPFGTQNDSILLIFMATNLPLKTVSSQ